MHMIHMFGILMMIWLHICSVHSRMTCHKHFQGDFQSSLGSCDADPFGDADLFYEDFQPPSSSILDEHQDVAIPRNQNLTLQR
jgi:hypothetical protein